MKNWINNKLVELGFEAEEGQGTVEYAVVLGVLVVAIIGAFQLTGITGGVGTAVGKIVTKLGE